MAPMVKNVVHTYNLHTDGTLCTCGGDCGAKTHAVVEDHGYHVCSEDRPCGVEHAGAIIHDKVRSYMLQHNERDYASALHTIWPSLPTALRDRYGLGGPMPWDMPAEGEDEQAGVEIDQRVRQRMQATGEDYPTALRAVLASDRALAERYANVGRNRR